MGPYIVRRLIQSTFTILGVILLTFLLFNIIAGDVTAQYVNTKLGPDAREAFMEKHKLDLPIAVNTNYRWWQAGFWSESQLYWHIRNTLTFQGRSFATEQTLLETIAKRFKYSLGIDNKQEDDSEFSSNNEGRGNGFYWPTGAKAIQGPPPRKNR